MSERKISLILKAWDQNLKLYSNNDIDYIINVTANQCNVDYKNTLDVLINHNKIEFANISEY